LAQDALDRWASAAPRTRSILGGTSLNGKLGANYYYLESGLLFAEFLVFEQTGSASLGMLLYPGDVIAAAQLDSKSSLLIRTLTDIRIRLFNDADLLLDQESATLLHNRGYRLWDRLGRQAAVMTCLPAEVRLAHLLVELALHVGRRSGNTCTIDLPLSRMQFAACLGLNPETLSRVLTKFKTGRLIETRGRRHLKILDYAHLAELVDTAGGDPGSWRSERQMTDAIDCRSAPREVPCRSEVTPLLQSILTKVKC
jgi:CRP-like cAMP-binding protein